jgi:dTDP-4-amino-4,6-dideoxygalactose transaminase
MKPIEMVDLAGQYEHIKDAVDRSMAEVIHSGKFINGPAVALFEQELGAYLNVRHVIGCANGTDALQIALMALRLPPGSEVIVPSFNYVSAAEVTALLGYNIVFADVHPHYYTIDPEDVRRKITARTGAVIAVHLFGQAAPMEELMQLCNEHHLYLIEDNAQSIGADYIFSDGSRKKAGTIGHIGTTSFFPSKNLGCYGDGGAIMTHDDTLAAVMRSIAAHGQSEKYFYARIGINSRLDTLQAAVLRVKLRELDQYIRTRQEAATYYDKELGEVEWLGLPRRAAYTNHVFHQYTVQVKEGRREALMRHLAGKGIPSVVYYPAPLHQTPAYATSCPPKLPVSEALSEVVLSLPMHTELTVEQLEYICATVRAFKP